MSKEHVSESTGYGLSKALSAPGVGGIIICDEVIGALKRVHRGPGVSASLFSITEGSNSFTFGLQRGN